MSIPAELLEILACPKCHGKVTLVDDSSALECPKDRLRFPIVDGIPVMLIDEAVAY
ncbi:MAG TPA: Trm112 family protein [Candidatus Dormibacteraeota bacterium]|nr:Trm112 family protein [Candidatus Dormibacteraeota bacterium]